MKYMEGIEIYGKKTSNDEGYSVQQTSDSGYVIAGYTSSYGAGNQDLYLVKTNAAGDTVWTRTFGGTGNDAGSSVQATSDGGWVIAGSTSSFGAGSADVYLIKTDGNGYVGVAEESYRSQATNRQPTATVARSLVPGAVAFDAMGRRVKRAQPGICFVREAESQVLRKVVLTR